MDPKQKPVLQDNTHKPYNPYVDPQLSAIKTEEPIIIDTREPFNDVVRHQDVIVGHQRNRTISDYPYKVRPWVKLYVIVTLVLLLGGAIWNYVH